MIAKNDIKKPIEFFFFWLFYRLDQCLQDLLRFTNELPIDRTFGHPKEALTHILNFHELEKDSCYDTDTNCIQLILGHIVSKLMAVK